MTQHFLERKSAHIPNGLATAHPLVAAHASGAVITDTDGNTYLDFTSGIGVMNVGHQHPRVQNAVEKQLRAFTHLSYQVIGYDQYTNVAEQLNAIVPTKWPRKTILSTSGAEAVENAVKIARSATGRPGIISFAPGFHGRSLLTTAMTGKSAPYKQAYGPYPSGTYLARYPYPLRGVSVQAAKEAFLDLIRFEIEAAQVAAVIIEPVAGEGGFLPAPPEFMRFLRSWTEEHGALFIADEIQTGFARTGKMFAVEHAGVEPDIITTAKSLAAGHPLAATTARADLFNHIAPGGLGGTYGGNALACAAALAVMSEMAEHDYPARATKVGEWLGAALHELQQRYPAIAEVRGLGAMLAIELVHPGTNEPDAALADRVLVHARENGLLVLKAGLHNNVIRFLAPLVVSEDQVKEAATILDEALGAATA